MMDMVMGKMDIISKVLSLCSSIYQMVGNMKTNKERCKHTEYRVKLLQQLVLAIKELGQMTPLVEDALRELCNTLTSAKALIAKYSRVTGIKSFLKSSTYEDKFIKMNEKLTDTFQLLSGALQVEQRDILLGRRPSERMDSCDSVRSNPTSPLPCPMQAPSLPAPLLPPTIMLPPTPMFPPMPMSSPTAPYPVGFFTPPIPACTPLSRCLQGSAVVANNSVSTNVLSNNYKVFVPGNASLTRAMAPVVFTAQQQTVVVRYVTNNTMPQ